MLNAFRHQRSTNAQTDNYQVRHCEVLNAFRHQRSTNAPLSAPLVVPVVRAQRLSASKIHKLSRSNVYQVLPTSAQRLSASKIHKRFNDSTAENGDKCSTPFGIKDPQTLCMHKVGLRRVSAQRLSASKIHKLTNNACTTRHISVLNAFRHQRSTNHRKPNEYIYISYVLNAFRHQRSTNVIAAGSVGA